MRFRGRVTVCFLAAVCALGVVACGGRDEQPSTGSGNSSTTAATTASTGLSDTLPPLTLIRPPEVTAAPVATTTSSTTKKPATPITTAKPVATPAPRAQPPEVKTFCDYSRSINLSIANANWVAGFNAAHAAVNAAVTLSPTNEVQQALLDLKAAFDAAQTAVDAGTMKTAEDLTSWLLQQLPDVQTRIATAVTSLKTYGNEHCK